MAYPLERVILTPKEEDEKEQSIYQMIIYRTGDY